MERIIGEFLEINADIVKQEANSKLPSFLSKLRANYFRRKLLKSLYKLEKSDYILNRNDISELFAYTFNNFPPKGSYNTIAFSKVIERNGNIDTEGMIGFDKITCIFNLSTEKSYFDFSISSIDENGEMHRFNSSLDRLYANNKNDYYNDIIYKINKDLLKEIINYVESVLKMYKR